MAGFLTAAVFSALLASPTSAQWTLSLGGSTGVAAMQMTVATETNVVIIDKFEQNPLHDENDRPVWGAVYSTVSNTARPLHVMTNSFCATGTWLSNGTLVNIGGNPRVDTANGTSSNGLQGRFKSLAVSRGHRGFTTTHILPGVRLFNPCADTSRCDIYENPQRIRLTSARWYPSSARLSDGSAIIYGGAYGGSWTNSEAINNPTYEFYPPKNIHGHNGLRIPAQFLKDSLPHNMFPHVILLPDNRLFIAANDKSMVFNWETNTESRLPNIPNGQRVAYPMSAPAALLPLTWENNYRPEVVLFGGSQLSDTLKENQVSSQSPTSNQVSRIALDASGIVAGWSTETMPVGRVMADATILPDGMILIINGAKTGTAGYGNAPDQASHSNRHIFWFKIKVESTVLYDPTAPAGNRFSSAGMPTSNIPRLYHSVSTLLPDGRVMIAGSNPNFDVSTTKYKTEYQVEYLNPPYMTKVRPSYTGLPRTWNYGQAITLNVQLPPSPTASNVQVSLMDLGFSTHGVHMDMRMVKLKCTLSLNRRTLTVTGPPNASIYPPGPGWIYVLADGVPSIAQKVLIGNGRSPPVDQGAIDNMLANTGGP
ncbi:hypothetical protein RSOLAG22IIIB_10541 [Rhizoctonia solani]|uniref:Galactose oxidase n=1 Tax=Rhizoctonia solani TaxID=456999 RepID=A0A0K6G3L2_9AGAM|nr:hypothetical protein RSOLAG22IIIB_10541 [Rhizoctonia solani]